MVESGGGGVTSLSLVVHLILGDQRHAAPRRIVAGIADVRADATGDRGCIVIQRTDLGEGGTFAVASPGRSKGRLHF